MLVTTEITISEELVPEDDVPDGLPSQEDFQCWATAAYLGSKTAITSMLITTVDEIHSLNKEYRDKDKATNVLSFPMQTPDDVDVCLLGDIVLCSTIIKQEAKQQSKTETSHWAHMVVHAMLHLQGYDHVKDDEAEVMETLEIEVLDKLGFDNPY